MRTTVILAFHVTPKTQSTSLSDHVTYCCMLWLQNKVTKAAKHNTVTETWNWPWRTIQEPALGHWTHICWQTWILRDCSERRTVLLLIRLSPYWRENDKLKHRYLTETLNNRSVLCGKQVHKRSYRPCKSSANSWTFYKNNSHKTQHCKYGSSRWNNN